MLVLKLMQTFVMEKNIFSMAFSSRFRIYLLASMALVSGLFTAMRPAVLEAARHPFFVNVIEFNNNPKENSLEISCKLFADDFENALQLQYKTPVDIAHPKDVKAVEKMVSAYLLKHLQLKINGKPVILQFVGFEKENEAVWGYLQVINIPVMKKLDITNDILYEVYPTQISIMHASFNGSRKSSRLAYPDTQASFEW